MSNKEEEEEIEKGNDFLSITSILIIILYGLITPFIIKFILKKNIFFFSNNNDKFLTIINIFMLIIPFIMYIIGILLFLIRKDLLKNSSNLRFIVSIFIGIFSSIFFMFFVDLLYNHTKVHGGIDASGQTHYQFIFFILFKILIFFCFYLNGIIMVPKYIKNNYLGPPTDNLSKIIVKINKAIISIGIIFIMVYCMYWISKSKEETVSVRKFQVASIGTFLAGGAAVVNLLVVFGLMDQEMGNEMIAQSI